MQHLYEISAQAWQENIASDLKKEAQYALENGKIILLPQLAFKILSHEMAFLSANYAHKKSKNISFNMKTDALNGAIGSNEELQQIKWMMQRYANTAFQFITHLFPSYQDALVTGRTSFRPIEIQGRISSYRKDDTRLHVDAFPATPNQGQRILRLFTNVNPNGRDRVWRVGEPFIQVAEQFLPTVSHFSKLHAMMLKKLKITKSYRTHYDHIMLQMHDHMKKDLNYQKKAAQTEIRFAPGQSWIVQTDHVSHAALSGQHVFEQTFYLPVSAMANPELSPLAVLEKMMGKKLV